MGSQGTASRLRRIVSQLRALLTPNHQGAEGSFLLTSTAVDLQSQLSRGEITSELLVLSYLDQIEKHNRKGLKLHALTSVADKDVLLARARHLDQERREGKVSRGPLHGIPIIIKDTIATPSTGLDTTCGSLALVSAKGQQDAVIAKKLLDAGSIIIGKASMTEWSGFRGLLTTGWSSAGGQVQSPYVKGGFVPGDTFMGHSTPCGSSAGSGVAVAAGFAPASIGCETDGSLVQPANRAALYALKLTPGSVDMTGAQPGNPDLDSAGPLAKTTLDVLNLANIIAGPGWDHMKVSDLPQQWSELRVGFVSPHEWQPADFVTKPVESFTAQSIREYEEAIRKIEKGGAKVVKDIPLKKLVPELDELLGAKLKESLESFLAFMQAPNIKTIGDVVQFNKDHADAALPPGYDNQSGFEQAAVNDPMPTATYNETFTRMRETQLSDVLKNLDGNEVDVIIAPAGGRIASVAAAAGCPVANYPLGFAEFNGRAHGVNVIARPKDERALIRVMAMWEKTFPEARKPPPSLL